MTLRQLFEQLQYGELQQLRIGKLLPINPIPDDQPIEPDDLREVIAHLNMGLTEIHKRVWLKSKELVLELYDHIQTYTLDKRFAAQNKLSPEPYRYIIDSEYDPFDNDLLKIEMVFDECGRCVPLNDVHDCHSLYTPAWNQIQIPLPFKESVVIVQYRADHTPIVYDGNLDMPVDVPPAALEPLLLFVAHRAFRSLNTDQNQESNNYLKKFEQSLSNMILHGYHITTNTSNLRLDQHGWV